MKTVTPRIPEDGEALLAELEAELGADRSEVPRRLIREGLEDWRKEKAVEGLRDHAITRRGAAEIADVSYVEVLPLAADADVDFGYTAEDVARDRDRVYWSSSIPPR